MNAIILCGGKSTRLGDIAKNVPKILLDVKGKTVLDWQLQQLQSVGIKEVVFAAGHLSEVLYKSVGLERSGLSLTYAIEKEPLGTGGAIKHAWEYASEQTQPVIILNGDVLAAINFKDMVSNLRPESDGIILASRVSDAADYGTLWYDKNYHLLGFEEKENKHTSGYINGGVYVFNPSVKKYFPERRTFSLEYDVFPQMRDLFVYESDRPWVDIGVPERLAWAREHWQE